MDIFLKTRNMDDPEVIKIVEEYDALLSDVPEHEQTILVRDRIYHQVVGKDGHGYCRTYGMGVPRKSVYLNGNDVSTSSSQSTDNLSTDPVVAQLVSELQQLKSRVHYLESKEPSTGQINPSQVPDAGSLRRASLMESVGDLNQNMDHNDPISPVNDEYDNQAGGKVCLLGTGVYKQVLAEGNLVEDGLELELDGKWLPRDYSIVLVKKAKHDKAVLEIPRPNINTLGEAVGHQIAWRTNDLLMMDS